MILQTFLPSKRDLELLFGFRLTPIRALALTALGILALFERSSGDVLFGGVEALAILATVLAAGALGAGAGAHTAGKAAKEAAKPTPAEKELKKQVSAIQTGVDPAAVDTAISQAATPIGSAIQAQQQNILQQGMTEGDVTGAGGRTAALQRQLTREASEGVAQAALGARAQEAQAALVRGEPQLGGKAQLAGLAVERGRTAAGLKAAKAEALAGIVPQVGFTAPLGG